MDSRDIPNNVRRVRYADAVGYRPAIGENGVERIKRSLTHLHIGQVSDGTFVLFADGTPLLSLNRHDVTNLGVALISEADRA